MLTSYLFFGQISDLALSNRFAYKKCVIYPQPATVKQTPLDVALTAPMEKIERVQYQTALAMTDPWKGLSRVKLYEELGWESSSDRRTSRRALQMLKIEHNTLLLRSLL